MLIVRKANSTLSDFGNNRNYIVGVLLRQARNLHDIANTMERAGPHPGTPRLRGWKRHLDRLADAHRHLAQPFTAAAENLDRN